MNETNAQCIPFLILKCLFLSLCCKTGRFILSLVVENENVASFLLCQPAKQSCCIMCHELFYLTYTLPVLQFDYCKRQNMMLKSILCSHRDSNTASSNVDLHQVMTESLFTIRMRTALSHSGSGRGTDDSCSSRISQ